MMVCMSTQIKFGLLQSNEDVIVGDKLLQKERQSLKILDNASEGYISVIKVHADHNGYFDEFEPPCNYGLSNEGYDLLLSETANATVVGDFVFATYKSATFTSIKVKVFLRVLLIVQFSKKIIQCTTRFLTD